MRGKKKKKEEKKLMCQNAADEMTGQEPSFQLLPAGHNIKRNQL